MSATRQISIVIGLAVLVAACGSDEDPAAEGTGTGGIRGPSSGSCIEEYSRENLRKREFAFDGTISAVSQEMGEDRLTFSVGEWFKGGSGDSVTLSATGLVGITSAGGVQVDTGTRMLVSGDDGFAFACGFSVPYTDRVAAEWEAALAS